MRRKTQDATSITSLDWGEADESILTLIAPSNPPSAPPTQKASIPYEPVVSANIAARTTQDTVLFKELGWHQFVAQRRSKSNVASLDKVDHPVQCLLKFYKVLGAPVNMSTKPWSRGQISAALSWGAHKSCMEHTDFLHKEFHAMILKSQWMVLPAEDVASLPRLRISPQALYHSETDVHAGSVTIPGPR